MRAVVIRQHGGPEVLALEDVPVPEPAANQVLVRTEVIGVSIGETLVRSGFYPFPLPMVMGAELAGTVVGAGVDVDPAWMGARVVAVTGGMGAYAEFAAVDARNLTRIPDELSARDAVASVAPGSMALALLHKVGLKGGETVLVEGGSGKIGGYLLEHAREFGAGRVVATASAKPARGADLVLDHGNPEWTDELEPVDVALDMAGGETANRVLDKLKPGGKILLYGSMTGEPRIDPAKVLGRGLTVIGCGGPLWFDECLGVRCPEFLGRVADKSTYIQPVDAVLPLDQAAEAHRRVLTSTGRILLESNI